MNNQPNQIMAPKSRIKSIQRSIGPIAYSFLSLFFYRIDLIAIPRACLRLCQTSIYRAPIYCVISDDSAVQLMSNKCCGNLAGWRAIRNQHICVDRNQSPSGFPCHSKFCIDHKCTRREPEDRREKTIAAHNL